MKFWIQSFLLGVPKIIVGYRSPDGILKRLEEMDTASIPGKVKRQGKGTWDGNMCINFAASLLECKSPSPNTLGIHLIEEVLKANVTGDGVWRIRRRERSSLIEVFRIEEAGHGKILTDEFINWRIKLAMNAPVTSAVQARPAVLVPPPASPTDTEVPIGTGGYKLGI